MTDIPELAGELTISRSTLEKLHIEGSRGLSDLCKLANLLGYHDRIQRIANSDGSSISDLILLLEDNPGAIEAIYDWVGEFYGTDDDDSPSMNRTAKNLIAARNLISNPKKWAQVGFGQRKDGTTVSSQQVHKAVRWCAAGAILKTGAGSMLSPAIRILEKVVGGAIGPFNDSASHEDVLAAFDIAICLAS